VDILVTDHRMPGMTGIELCRRVKELYPVTVRLMLSGYADTAELLRALDEGVVFRMLAKPADLNNIRKVIDRSVEQIKLIRCFQRMVDELNGTGQKYNYDSDPTQGLIRLGFGGNGFSFTREKASELIQCLFQGVESDSGISITSLEMSRRGERLRVNAEFGGCHRLVVEMALLSESEEKGDAAR
jgi:DNA-binding NarL/FixJ family response regulator